MNQRNHRRDLLLPWVAGALFALVFAGAFGNYFYQAREGVRQASDEWKKRHLDDFPGLADAAKNDPSRRGTVIARANKELCPCRCGYTVAACLHDDADCPEKTKNMGRIKGYAADNKRG